MTNALRLNLAWKWTATRRILENDGLLVLLWEILYQGLKPLLMVCESVVWWWNLAWGRSRFKVHGNAFTVLPRDRGISRELTIYRKHEPMATQLLKQFLKPGMTVVEIGGNLGYYALLEAQMVGNAGRVIAIEPVTTNFAQLSQNVAANGYRNTILHNVAIGASNGSAAMYIGKKSNWHSLHPVPWETREISVCVSTLDALLAQHNIRSVDLIRMDLEGFEIEVIHGMAETLENYSPRLLVELHPHVTGVDAMLRYLRQLKTLGYNLDWVLDNERDRPIRWWFLRPEKISLEELLTDPRITTYPRALQVLLARNDTKRVPTEHSRWTPSKTVLDALGSVPRG
jgi:FkbM family methyltransferase